MQPANLRALDDYHPLLLTPTALDDPANIWCLPPGPLWWSNAILDLQDDFHTVMAEIDRAGVTDGLTFQPPRVTLDPGRPTDRQLGRPTSMRYINGRKLRTVGDYRNLSPAERAYLDDQERCWTGFGWPGRDRDRRRLGVRGPSKGTRSPTACAVPSLSPLLSSARPSSAYYVTNGPRRAGRTPSRTPTSTRGADAWRRIAPKLSTTKDFRRGTSTKSRYFWLVGLLALVLGV